MTNGVNAPGLRGPFKSQLLIAEEKLFRGEQLSPGDDVFSGGGIAEKCDLCKQGRRICGKDPLWDLTAIFVQGAMVILRGFCPACNVRIKGFMRQHDLRLVDNMILLPFIFGDAWWLTKKERGMKIEELEDGLRAEAIEAARTAMTRIVTEVDEKNAVRVLSLLSDLAGQHKGIIARLDPSYTGQPKRRMSAYASGMGPSEMGLATDDETFGAQAIQQLAATVGTTLADQPQPSPEISEEDTL